MIIVKNKYFLPKYFVKKKNALYLYRYLMFNCCVLKYSVVNSTTKGEQMNINDTYILK